MKFYKKLSLKFYYFRHRNWSAPTIMGTFIVFCMMLVYLFESIGLLKSERTIHYRIRTPEKVIMTNNEALNILSLTLGNKFEKNEKYKQDVNLQFKHAELEYKKQSLNTIISIIYSGMNNQLSYEENVKKNKCNGNDKNNNNNVVICDNSTMIYDIIINKTLTSHIENESEFISNEQVEDDEHNYFDI